MPFKNILVLVDDSATSHVRLNAAISLAQAHEAHLTALGLGIEFVMPAPVVASLPIAVMDEQRAEQQTRLAKRMDKVRIEAERTGLAIEIRSEMTIAELAGDVMARHARHADLTIVGQPDTEQDGFTLNRRLLEAAFLETGRPALAIPHAVPGGEVRFPNKLAIVAWDGSREAARAMNDALPLLKQAESVRLITVNPEKQGERLGELPGADATLHLARHGIKAELRRISGGGLSVGNAILAEIGDSGADLLVMGGFGHSRMREMILGGATASLLDTMTCATLLAH